MSRAVATYRSRTASVYSARAGLVTGPPFGCVPLGTPRCEASAFSPVTLLMRHIAVLTTLPGSPNVAPGQREAYARRDRLERGRRYRHCHAEPSRPAQRDERRPVDRPPPLLRAPR